MTGIVEIPTLITKIAQNVDVTIILESDWVNIQGQFLLRRILVGFNFNVAGCIMQEATGIVHCYRAVNRTIIVSETPILLNSILNRFRITVCRETSRRSYTDIVNQIAPRYSKRATILIDVHRCRNTCNRRCRHCFFL